MKDFLAWWNLQLSGVGIVSAVLLIWMAIGVGVTARILRGGFPVAGQDTVTDPVWGDFAFQPDGRVGVYQMVAVDEGLKIILPDGKPAYIEWAPESDPVAVYGMRYLKYSCYLGTDRFMGDDAHSSAIYFVGIVRDKLPTVPSREEGGKWYLDKPERFRFELKGWYIETPYFEYPQGEGDAYVPPVWRMTLEAGDFLEGIPPGTIHFRQDHRMTMGREVRKGNEKRIYWIGMDPAKVEKGKDGEK